MPLGTATTILGLAIRVRRWTFWMKYLSMRSVTSKSAITPSLSGRMATMLPGVRPIMRLASTPDGDDLAVVGVERDHARLVEHDAAAAHVDEGVGRAEVDRHVTAEECQRIAHREREPFRSEAI